MAKTVVGLFDAASSERVEDELKSAGFSRTEVSKRTKLSGGSVSDLEGLGIPSDDARRYADALDRGQTLVTVDARDEDATKAAEIMRRFEMSTYYETSDAGVARSADTTIERDTAVGSGVVGSGVVGGAMIESDELARGERLRSKKLESEETVPVVEEELEIGKREIDSGGVRLSSRVVEEPVEADVTLREEKVYVERHPVDRPATSADVAAAEAASDIEIRERAEKAVVGKSARVVEEVSIGKEIGERTEHIRDTVAKTEVDVEPLGMRGGETWMRDYRAHFDRTYASDSTATWDDYEPAYRMGYELAGDRRYGGRDWGSIERDVRMRWETDRPGTWERVKGAMRHAFERARGSVASHHP